MQASCRGGRRPLHGSRRPTHDLLELCAGDEWAPPRGRARAAPPLTLAIHPGALGDVLLAIPALRALKRQRPDDALVIAAQPRIGRLLEILGVVDRSVDFDRLGLDSLFAPAPDEAEHGWPSGCAADLRHAARVVAWVGSREPGFVRRLTALVPGSIVAPSVGRGRPVWEHLVETIGARVGDRTLRVRVEAPTALGDEAARTLARCGASPSDRLLILHPGAGAPAKRWPARGFAAVLEHVAALPRVAVVVHQGPADAEAIAALPEPLIARAIVLREPPLPVLAGVLSHAAGYLGNDSGISHLAAALGAPAVVLFGAHQLPWRPWAEHVEPFLVSLATAEESDVARVTRELMSFLA